ncbi:hypothetical protein ACFLWJ_00235 [Chloroflexota bacterium]
MRDIDKFFNLTEWKNRIHLVYWMAIHNIINPTADKTIGVYPCCGADALVFFLTTDVETAYFVDSMAFGHEEQMTGMHTSVSPEFYWEHKALGGNLGGGFSWTSLLEATRYLIIPLHWELEAMGAKNVLIAQIEENVHQIDFDWAYWGEEQTRHRRIMFFSKVDTRFPGQYPDRLKSLLSGGVDLYMEKAAKDQYAQYNAPLDWGKRWDQFRTFTKFNLASVIITTQIPEDGVSEFKLIEDDTLKEHERNGAKFGVWTAALMIKQQPT